MIYITIDEFGEIKCYFEFHEEWREAVDAGVLDVLRVENNTVCTFYGDSWAELPVE